MKSRYIFTYLNNFYIFLGYFKMFSLCTHLIAAKNLPFLIILCFILTLRVLFTWCMSPFSKSILIFICWRFAYTIPSIMFLILYMPTRSTYPFTEDQTNAFQHDIVADLVRITTVLGSNFIYTGNISAVFSISLTPLLCSYFFCYMIKLCISNALALLFGTLRVLLFL